MKIFNAYQYFFYRIYSWNLKMWGERDSPHFNTVLVLSGLNWVNIVTLLMFLEEILQNNILTNYLRETGSTKVYAIVGFILVFGLNYLVFLYKRNYKTLLKKFKNETDNQKKSRFWYCLAYAIISYAIFFILAIIRM